MEEEDEECQKSKTDQDTGNTTRFQQPRTIWVTVSFLVYFGCWWISLRSWKQTFHLGVLSSAPMTDRYSSSPFVLLEHHFLSFYWKREAHFLRHVLPLFSMLPADDQRMVGYHSRDYGYFEMCLKADGQWHTTETLLLIALTFVELAAALGKCQCAQFVLKYPLFPTPKK